MECLTKHVAKVKVRLANAQRPMAGGSSDHEQLDPAAAVAAMFEHDVSQDSGA
jgi:hypothetical protein